MARQNDHTRAEELISAYLDKRISAEEKDFFERHIASCADCRAQLETTRSMVATLHAMPVVKAPRSFVLPREMGRQSAAQPRRSFLPLYPALRLATVIAAMAFGVLFAGDLLINQSVGGRVLQSIPAAAPAPIVVQAPAASRAAAPTPAPTETSNYAAPAPTGSAQSMVGAAAPAAISTTAVVAEATALSMTTATPAAPAGYAAPQPKAAVAATPEPTEPLLDQQAAPAATEMKRQPEAAVAATPEPIGPTLDQQAAPAAEQTTATNVAAPAPTIEPLHVVEIVLLGLAVVLGIATLIVRRKQA